MVPLRLGQAGSVSPVTGIARARSPAAQVRILAGSLVLAFVSLGVRPSGHEWDDLADADQGPQKLSQPVRDD